MYTIEITELQFFYFGKSRIIQKDGVQLEK